MKVGTLVVGAIIGGAVWVFGIRAASAAARDTTGSPETGTSAAPPPPPDPKGVIRDAQGNIVSTVDETPPIISPPAGDAATTTEIVAIAKSATEQTVVQTNVSPAGVDGATGSAQPLKTDPINGTVQVDLEHSAGGQGTDQMSATSSGHTAPGIAPGYADAMPAYTDYLTARYGSTQGMTQMQIDAAFGEAARVGGLPL